MSVYSYRYTDTQVRTYPRLTELAIEYAADYAGEWDFMIAARSLALQSGTLPTATARAVLNAMRADPKVVMSLPELEDLEPAPRHQRIARVVDLPENVNDYVIETVRWPFNVEIRWNRDWYLATTRRSRAAHLLNHSKSHLTYYPMFGKPDYSIKRQYEFKLIAECGVRLATGQLFDTDRGRYTCNSCTSLRLERNKEFKRLKEEYDSETLTNTH